MSAWFHKQLNRLNATTLTGDVRAALLMTNTTVEDDLDTAEFMDEIVDLDEYDGTNYARVALTGEAFAFVGSLNGYRFTSDPVVFDDLGVGTRQAAGVMFYLHVTDDSDSVPLLWLDTGGFPLDGNGLNLEIQPHAANGWAVVRNAP